MTDIDCLENLARLLYEEMVRRVVEIPDWSVSNWDIQPQKLRDDWRAIAKKAQYVCMYNK